MTELQWGITSTSLFFGFIWTYYGWKPNRTWTQVGILYTYHTVVFLLIIFSLVGMIASLYVDYHILGTLFHKLRN